ncbi:MAG: hypothetical protein N2595_02780 [bacterium]|nr:hypothetical protein [bacterium]
MYTLSVFTLCAVISLLVVAPPLLKGYYCILDSASFYDMASRVDLLQPATYLHIPFLENRARPATFMLFFPAYFTRNATVHYWIQTLLLLTLPSLLLSWVVYRVTGKIGYGAAAAIGCFFQPSLTENYYTIFKAEPWILAGCAYVTWLLWLQLFAESRLAIRVLAHIGAVVATACVYWLKEPGGAYFGVYVFGALLLVWGSKLRWQLCVRRLLFLSILQVTGFAVLVASVARLPSLYSASGTSEYSASLPALATGVVRVGGFFLASASYVLPAVGILGAALGWLRGRSRHSDGALTLRPLLAWSGYFFLLALGMLSALVPWQALEARQYLVAASAAPIAAVCAIATAAVIRSHMARRLSRALVSACMILCVVLLLLQCAYALITGPYSEGIVRYYFDRAHDELFRYLAKRVPKAGCVYFLMDETFPEPRHNAQLGLKVFYGRSDIRCIYPADSHDFSETGLIAVTEYAIPANYDRMPLHHYARDVCWSEWAPLLPALWLTGFVYETRIWYATNTYHGPQYRSVWGVPAFWDLKRGVYRFGWTVYALTNVPELPERQSAALSGNVVINSGFARGLTSWSAWGVADQRTNQLRVVRAEPDSGASYALRIENPGRELIGVKQHVPLVSGEVYRLCAAVRSVATNDSASIFGGRVAVFLPPQAEQQLIWMSEYTRWWKKELVFTNQVTGTAVVYAHLGYGNVATTGEFSSIRLERIERPPR